MQEAETAARERQALQVTLDRETAGLAAAQAAEGTAWLELDAALSALSLPSGTTLAALRRFLTARTQAVTALHVLNTAERLQRDVHDTHAGWAG